MKAFRSFLLVLLCFFPLFVSCHKGEFSVSQVLAQPYVVASDVSCIGDMGLSLYVMASIPSLDGLTMVVTDPASNLIWSFSPSKVEYEGAVYYGTSDILMPQGSFLPTGAWSLEIRYKDGRTLNFSFEVSYRDIEGAMERAEGSGELPVFDSSSNLTVI